MGSKIDLTASESMAGQLLIAMPQMADDRFERSVIYMCVHNGEGAMGLVVNKLLDSLSFADMLEQLKIEPGPGPRTCRFISEVRSSPGVVLCSTPTITNMKAPCR